MNRPKLSLAMIVRDGERTLDRCLRSVAPWVDEMVVVDTGSTDRTREVASDHGARVETFAWCDDFSAARNASLEHARGEWVVWMDADDEIDADNGRRLRALVEFDAPDDLLGWSCRVRCPAVRGPSDTLVEHVRVLRGGRGVRFDRPIHENVVASIGRAGGRIGRCPVEFLHSGADHTPEGRRRKLERDLRLLRTLLERDPDDGESLYHLATTLEFVDRTADAIASARRCRELAEVGSPLRRRTLALETRCRIVEGEFPAAERVCATALGEYPADPELRFLSGVLNQRSGRLRNARADYECVLASGPGRELACFDEGVFGVKTHFNLARVEVGMGLVEGAVSRLHAVVARWPRLEAAWELLGSLLARIGALDEVERLLDAVDAAGHAELALIWRARLAEARGDHARAEALLESGVAGTDDPGRLLASLAAMRIGRGEQIDELMERIRADCPDPERIVSGLNRLTRSVARSAVFETGPPRVGPTV